ncbi:MAG: hypothetical protein WA428_01820 [Candidatus Cybelea sp.]
MKRSTFSRCALSGVAAAMLAGCSGSEPPIGGPGATSYGAAGHIAAHPAPATAKDAWSGDLLYVATGGDVYVLSYPSGKVVGRLGVEYADNLCSDKAGDVFVVQGAYETVLEYSHRGKLLQTLQTYDVPQSCSVDPTTGNLAVPTVDYSCVYIYPNARPPAQSVCNDPFAIVGLCAYDSHGNLFLDGAAGGVPHHSYVPYLAELPKGSATFHNYALGHRFGYDDYDSINWDGTHVTLSNPNTHSIYRMHISHKAKIVGTTHVRGWVGGFCCSAGGTQTWLKDGMFIAQWHSGPQLAIWSYPTGGRPTKVLPAFASAGTSVDGVVLSQAAH